ncbi:MAG: hypothetical protein H7122_17645 [Chitinophagaceae bacterium]|nr:hypothetical protein [Chitinophagaceae bacterium]
MNPGSFWLRLLNVYPNEWWIVKRLYLFQFFQGAGIAFFFTAVFALFLEKFPITELSIVLISSALLLWVVGFFYTRLEHAVSISRFNMIVIGTMIASILLLATASFFVAQNWFYYLLLAWFNVLYLVNNLQFWGIATLFFDLRQSKRLFAVISAGDIPAKFFGYTLALIFVPYTGTRNLLFMGAACMLASIPFLRSILKSGELELIDRSDQIHKEKQSRGQIGKLVKNFATNIFIRRIAFISLIASASIILINYGFYAEVRKAYQDDVALARFIASFFVILRITALVTKMLFSSRLTESIGIRPALFITPLGMLILTASIIAAGWMSTDIKIVFYLFGVSSIIVDVLRTSFNAPVLLALMQPLSTHERLRAHNIVKGLMDPFASLFCGLLLYISFNIQGRVDLMFLCYTLTVLGVLWLVGIVLVNRQYLQMLIKTISTRYFSQEEFNLNDETIIQHIRKKMSTGTELEVISILKMLTSKVNPVAEDLIIELLSHPSDQVRIESLRLINNKYINIKPKLQTLLISDVSVTVKNEIVKTMCRIADNGQEISKYLDDPDEDIRKAATTGILDNNDVQINKMAETAISNLLLSTETENKKKVISILTEVKDKYDHPAHMHLVNDPDHRIRDLAITAVGKACCMEVLVALVQQIHTNEKSVLAALYHVGTAAITPLKEQIISDTVSDSLKQKLIGLCGRIGGEKAQQVLLELVKKQPQQNAAIIKALHRSKYSTDASTHKLFENIARLYIIYGVELLYMQRYLSKKSDGFHVLNSSLQYEIQDIRETLLCLFECMYDREKINQAKFGLNGKRKESIANSMEIIELTVKKDIGRNFNILFDITAIEHRCAALRSLFTEKQFVQVENILARILSEKPITYQSWTKACSLYFSKKFLHRLDASLYEKYIHSENTMLRETALFASATS